MLPRHMQIIYLINARHLDSVRAARRVRRRARRAVADRRAPRPPRAHGPPRLPRLAPRQRRLGAAHRADAQDGVQGPAPRSIPTASSTRPTASPSAAGCTAPIPNLTALLVDDLRRAHPRPIRTGIAHFATLRRGRRRAGRGRRHPPRQQGGAGARDRRDQRRRASIRARSSTCRSSASTNTSASS